MRVKILISVLVVTAIGFGVALYFNAVDAGSKNKNNKPVVLNLSANPISIQADGVDQSIITASLPCNGKNAYSNVPITFSTNLGTLSNISTFTNASCQATTTLKSTQIGEATVKATGVNLTKTVMVTATTEPNTTGMFSDDFSSALSKWTQVYNGYGTIEIENQELSMAPKASTEPTETHAPLVVAGENSWDDYTFEARMSTLDQLRTGSTPNAWEVGWLIFRYTDDNHFYYFIQKPNGIELGKEIVNSSGAQDQKFLVTQTTPTLGLNQWNKYKIVLKGANIKVYINDALVADYTDSDNPYLNGKIGLYNEDAHVHFDDIVVSKN